MCVRLGILTLICFTAQLQGKPSGYVPFAIWKEATAAQYKVWKRKLVAHELVQAERAGDDVPVGARRSREVALLEDLMLREHHRFLNGSRAQARNLISRRLQRNPDQLRGDMAKALFIGDHPDWSHGAKHRLLERNANPWVAGNRTPIVGQIRFHRNGLPEQYARDLSRDYSLLRVFIPDDHVESTKEYLRRKAEESQLAGQPEKAARLWRDVTRVTPTGRTSGQVEQALRQAAKSITSEGNSAYTSLGASLALSLGRTAWDWSSGASTRDEALYHTARATSIIGVGVGTDSVLTAFQDGGMRGTVKGSLLIGTALLLTESVWLIQEYGGMQAFYRPEFYEGVVGGAGALTMTVAGGTTGAKLGAAFGPWGSAVGGALGGFVGGTTGYIGGRSGTRVVFEVFWPEKLQEHERQELENIKSAILNRIEEAQALTPAARSNPS